MDTWRCGVVFILGLLLWGGGAATGDAQPRYGGGLQLMGSTVVQGVGPGLHVRGSVPINHEFSLGGGATVTWLAGGTEGGAYALDLEASLLLTLPNSTNSSPYFLGGIGYHRPIGNGYADTTAVSGTLDAVGGPTFHVGLGKVWRLQAVSVYVELTPTLFFRRERTDLLVPLRGGIIF